jgi:hypothetical protein
MACGGKNQPCCGTSSTSAGSSSGTCTTGLTCRVSAGTIGYTCQM